MTHRPMTEPTARSAHRRRLSLIAASLVAASGLVAVAVTNLGPVDGSQNIGEAIRATISPEDCPAELVIHVGGGAPAGCAHADEVPEGVDITKPVSTRELLKRVGAAPTAGEAAQDEGIPVPTIAASASDRVVCDGDGTSGYRTQAIYVTTADRANRFAEVEGAIKRLAAGVDAVFKFSAAKTGGVRNVRYVTTSNGDGTCSAKVLNVTLPPGSLNSFQSSITAMQNAGFTSGARKYLMWADTNVAPICGIALTYLDSTPGQTNDNNGDFPQYARTDTGCWGNPSATDPSQSVEAHELSHVLGSIQRDAPNATYNNHCTDESDRMCYSDAPGVTMRQVCSPDQEALFDCNDDDYYSTYPPAGSYLDTHWNTADSRFLIGGGDGTGGGSAGVPTRLGGTLSVNNPAIPGLPTNAAVNLEIPAGRTVNTTWKSSRTDCVFSDPTAAQTAITCDAKSATAATITATVTDSAGEKIVRTSPLTFASTARTAQAGVAIDATTSGTYTACPSGKAYLSSVVRDGASGVGVKGVTVAWMRTVGSTATQVATAITGADGRAVTKAPVTIAAGTYTAKTTTATAFPAVTSGALTATVAAEACTTTLTGTADETTVQAGDPVTVTGTLTRTLPGGGTAPAAGETVRLHSQAPGATAWTVAGTAVTGADGTYTITIKPVASATVQARFAARTGFVASNGPSTALTVNPWQTNLSTTAAPASLMAGGTVTLTGRLTQTDGTTTSGVASASLTVTYPLAGGTTAATRVTTKADGTYSIPVKPTGPGAVTIKYAGKPGWPAATATTTLAVGTWDTAVTASATPTDVMAGTGITVSGLLTQSDGTSTTKMGATAVNITYPVGGDKVATVKATTASTGAYTALIKPLASGTVTVTFPGKPGWAAATTTTNVTVREWTSALSMNATRGSDGYVTVTGRLTSTNTSGQTLGKSGAVVEVTYQYNGTTTRVAKATTTSTGTYSVKVKPLASGPVTARYTGTPGWAAASAAPVTITVP